MKRAAMKLAAQKLLAKKIPKVAPAPRGDMPAAFERAKAIPLSTSKGPAIPSRTREATKTYLHKSRSPDAAGDPIWNAPSDYKDPLKHKGRLAAERRRRFNEAVNDKSKF